MSLIFTDLDGTLLDLITYDPGPVRRAIGDLQVAGVPIVFCSSKTRAEQEAIRDDLGVSGPFIVENGSAVLIPDTEGGGRQVTELGCRRSEITSVLAEVRRDLGLAFMTYEDLSIDQAATITGLDWAAAERAADRDFSETILTSLHGPGEEDALRNYLAGHGLQVTCGGRFLTVTGNGADKGVAVRTLHRLLGGHSAHPVTVGIGDSENDLPLLAACDRRFLVRRPDGSWVHHPDLAEVELLDGAGPEGWCQMAMQVLRDRNA